MYYGGWDVDDFEHIAELSYYFNTGYEIPKTDDGEWCDDVVDCTDENRRAFREEWFELVDEYFDNFF